MDAVPENLPDRKILVGLQIVVTRKMHKGSRKRPNIELQGSFKLEEYWTSHSQGGGCIPQQINHQNHQVKGSLV